MASNDYLAGSEKDYFLQGLALGGLPRESIPQEE
jgi:hypothetical protein